jgi:hypothetical protein
MDAGMVGRRNTLERRASALCRGTGEYEVPLLVVFRRVSPGVEGARGVGLEPDLSYMSIMHQEAVIPTGEALNGPCVLLP